MESTISKHHKNISAIIHASTFSKYLIPFGNFIIPLLLWTANKSDSRFIDHNGKEALNFQISILLYSILLGIITIPLFVWGISDFINIHDLLDHNTHDIHFNGRHWKDFFHMGPSIIFFGITGILGVVLFILDIYCSIIATIRTNDGLTYRYPMTIRFIK
ncbi:MAG: DUF4870 domain-containing protein [Flavobacteriaceae bacterium]|nr:DUF4870 domain-containing protein [Flavobacteriaceae bacterium]